MIFFNLSFLFISGVLVWENIFFSLIFILVPSFFIKKKSLIPLVFIAGILQGLWFNYPYIKLKSFFKEHKKVVLYGSVENVDKKKFIFKVDKIYNLKIDTRVIFFIYSKSKHVKVNRGNYLRIEAILEKPEHLNPGTFNYKNYLKSKGIHFTSYIHTPEQIVFLDKYKKSKNFISSYRETIKKLILKNEKFNNFYKGLLIAIITGDKSFLDNDAKNFLIKNGISHLFSISGLHVGIFFIFSLLFLRFLLLKFNNFYLPYIFSAIVTIFYIFFMGGNYPAIRAGFVLIFFVLSLFIKRVKDPYRLLGLIFFLIIVVEPYSFYNISFQYSFAVVFALIFYGQNRIIAKNWNRLFDFFAVIIIAFLAGLPLTCYHFSIIYLKGLYANILAVPLFSLIVIPLSVLTIFAGYIPNIAEFFVNIIYFIFKALIFILNLFQNFKPIYLHSFDIIEMILIYILIFLTIFYISKMNRFKKRDLYKVMVSMSIIAIFYAGYFNIFYKEKNKVGIIDIGRGEAVFLKDDEKNYLIIQTRNLTVVKRKIIPVLLKESIKEIEVFIVPYFQRGVKKLKKSLSDVIKINRVMTIDKRYCKGFRDCFVAKEGKICNSSIKILFPPTDKFYLLNFKNASVVLQFKGIIISYLFTKDIAEYINFSYKKKYKALVAYKSEVKNFTEKDIIITRKKKRGYQEVLPDENYKITNYVDEQNRFGLLNLFL